MSWFSNIFKPKPSTFGVLGNLFNSYSSAIKEISNPTDKSLDVIINVRIRLFGDPVQKREEWEAYQAKIGVKWGPVQWANVSSGLPQIWGDLEERNGELIINTLCLGHELQHSLKLLDQRVCDPDKYAAMEK